MTSTFRLTVAAIALALVIGLAGCGAPPRSTPGKPVEVKVAVREACQPAQVKPSTLPSSQGFPADIYEAVKRVLADRAVLLGDRERLVAANTDPCPEVKP